MKHIVIDARFINSGTGTYVRELLNHLQEIDKTHRYTVLVPSKDMDYWKPTADNFTLHPTDFSFYSVSEQMGLKKVIEQLQPDLVHFAMPQQPIFYRGKKVTTMHDMTLINTYNSDINWLEYKLKQSVGRWVWKKIARDSSHVIAITNNTKKEYQDFTNIPDEKISVIYEAGEAKPGEITPYEDLLFKDFIIYVGQQPDYKNIRRLAQAHQKLLKKYPDLGLILVGRLNKDTQANKDHFESMGYKNIHFTGFIDDSQRDWLYTKCIAYTFPSLMEGFGLPPLEAMAYGVAVVSSNASCMPEVLGDAPVYFDPLNIDDMAEKIELVMSDEKLRQEMIANGFDQVKKYSWRHMAEQTLEVYKKVLDEN